MKKLNNKGFTLIELLAVIVILAVVMGVATTQVLSAMNNSRKSSLQDSAMSAADAFRTAYAEFSMGGSTNFLGLTDTETTNLLKGTAVNLNSTIGDKLNITVGAADSNNNYTTESFVFYNTTSNSFTVCLVASSKGSYYVAAVANAAAESPSYGGKKVAAKKMWACSDNKKGW